MHNISTFLTIWAFPYYKYFYFINASLWCYSDRRSCWRQRLAKPFITTICFCLEILWHSLGRALSKNCRLHFSALHSYFVTSVLNMTSSWEVLLLLIFSNLSERCFSMNPLIVSWWQLVIYRNAVSGRSTPIKGLGACLLFFLLFPWCDWQNLHLQLVLLFLCGCWSL